MCDRKLLLQNSQNPDNFETFCNDRRNPFHFACGQWYLCNNPQCNTE